MSIATVPSPYHDPAFYKKLGIKPGHTVLFRNAPSDFTDALLPNLPGGVTVLDELEQGQRPDIIILWLNAEEDLNTLFGALRWTVKPDGAVWAVIPKKTVAKKRGINLSFEGAQAAALPTGLVDNKTLTFSDEEYGIRYVVRAVERGKKAGAEFRLRV